MTDPRGANRSALPTRLSTAWRIRSAVDVGHVPAGTSTRPVTPAAASREPASPALRREQLADVRPLQPQAEPVLVAPGQQQQVVGEPGQPLGFRAGAADRRGQLGLAAAGPAASSSSPRSTASGLRSSWLASATKARCRASAPLQPAEQVVHRAASAATSSRVRRHLDGRAPRPRLGHRGHLPSQALHRGQRRPRQPVGAQARDRDEDDPADRELPHDLALGGSYASSETAATATQPGWPPSGAAVTRSRSSSTVLVTADPAPPRLAQLDPG